MKKSYLFSAMAVALLLTLGIFAGIAEIQCISFTIGFAICYPLAAAIQFDSIEDESWATLIIPMAVTVILAIIFRSGDLNEWFGLSSTLIMLGGFTGTVLGYLTPSKKVEN